MVSDGCAFPDEAANTGVRAQRVQIRILVRPDGTPAEVQVLDDPGLGFADAVRRCALAQRFEPAKNEQGEPIQAWTPTITVTFVR
jgi:TonB family protein